MNNRQEYSRKEKAGLNILITLLCQLISLICGFIIPKLILDKFGSEAYGATASISQFLAYISLLEGGIGGVARAALYKPISENNKAEIGAVLTEIKSFFRVIGYIFGVYVIILACSYKFISGFGYYDWILTFLLVIVISISTFAQYFIGMSYNIFLNAAQKTYIVYGISCITISLNAFASVWLIFLGADLITVKFLSSIVFALRPVLMWMYVTKNYDIVNKKTLTDSILKQKWTGLGQHIAYFLHSNTDVVVLTLFSNLKMVAIYAVYNMVISNIQSINISFTSGMEAIFGDMIAKGEKENLRKTFMYYETLISVISMILYSVTAVLIVPFISIYTRNTNDVNYIRYTFSIVLLTSSLIYCLRVPYHNLTIAAGHFKQTRVAAYGEALINIIMSLLLVTKYQLIGVACATLIATVFRFIFYVWYLSKNIIYLSVIGFIKRQIINVGISVLIVLLGAGIISFETASISWIRWVMSAVVVFCLACIVTILINALFYRGVFIDFINRMFKRNIYH